MISVIIATYQREDRIRRTLALFAGLAAPQCGYEIIVVDDGSEPPLGNLTGPHGVPLQIVRAQHGGPGAARNTGVAAARGHLLVFGADDCEPEADWLLAYEAAHASDPHCALGGAIVHGLPRNACATAADLLIRYMRARYNSNPAHATFFTPNNLAVPAAEFRAVGGFDPQFGPAGEDRDFCTRWVEAGYRMVSVDAARVRHIHPLTLISFLRMQFAHGRGSMLYHKERARRRGTAVRLETPGFYAGLVAFPLTANGPYGFRHLLLLLLSQIAVAAGAARALMTRR